MVQEKKVLLLPKASGAGDGYYPVAAARAQDHRRQIIGGAMADKLSGNNDAVQILVEGAKAGDPIPLTPTVVAAGGVGSSLLAVVGIVAISTAVTVLAGGAVSPVVAFGSFLILLGGLVLAMASVRGTTS